MGVFREVMAKGLEFVREDIVPLRMDLIKAGILSPDGSAYEQKANLTDPTNYGTMNYGYKEKWSLLDYRKSRQITYSDPIVASIIQLRLNQAAAFTMPQPDKFKLGYKIKLRDSKKKPTKQEEIRIEEFQQFLLNCGVPESFEDTPERRRRDSFEQFIRKITRDTLTFDQINFEITPRKNGSPYSFIAIDPESIRIVPDEKEKAEYFGGSGYDSAEFFNILPPDGVRETPFNEFKPKNPRYVQLIQGVPHHVFDEWEMAFGVRNPRTDLLSHGYGLSEVEMLVTTITSHMNAESYNRRFFTHGSTVKGILAFEGNVPPDQLEAFRRQWYMQATGVTNAWRTPIMALPKDTKLQWQDLDRSNREMEFGKWLEYCIKTICGVFQIDPLEIGFDISKQTSGEKGGSAGISGQDHLQRVLYSQEKGLRPLLKHIQSLINDYIIYRLDPNFEFEFVGLNAKSEDDELKQAGDQAKIFKTVNEIRAENDMKPIPPIEEIKSLGDIILDPGWIQAFVGAKQMEAQAEMGVGPDGQPIEGPDGEDDGEPGDEPGDESGEEDDLDDKSMDELDEELAGLQGEKTKKSLTLEL